MLIKYYDVSGTLHIIEPVNNVKVYGYSHSYRDRGSLAGCGPEVFATDMLLDKDPRLVEARQDSAETLFEAPDSCRLVYFEHQGVLKRLIVFGVAYVCNDNGKTIETVRYQANTLT